MHIHTLLFVVWLCSQWYTCSVEINNHSIQFPCFLYANIGRKAGYLGSAFFVGSFTGSLMWGWLSDILGRRPVMLFGLCGTIASELFFGFSQNFAWALAARFTWGFLNGNIGVAKTYLSEVCISLPSTVEPL